MSQGEVKRQYAKMLKLHEGDQARGVNCYSCVCGIITKTKDIDAGTTPFLLKCKCGEMARSSFYSDIAPEQEPTIEWYRPTIPQTVKMRNKANMLDHILAGGLDYRISDSD